ncbi:hypothetical protein M5G07_04755 [Serratia symbiotica]|nr:hypothetical protein [Serratia symbiotica]
MASTFKWVNKQAVASAFSLAAGSYDAQAAAIDVACAGYLHYLEAQWRTLNYPDIMSLMRSLKGIDVMHLHQGRESRLMSRRQFAALQAAYPRLQGQFPLSYHLIYGVIYRD